MTSNAQTVATVDAAIPADLDGYDPQGLLTAEETQRGIDKWCEIAREVAREWYSETVAFSSHTQHSPLNRGERTRIQGGPEDPDDRESEVSFDRTVEERWEAWFTAGGIEEA